jgi:hypothetical protein
MLVFTLKENHRMHQNDQYIAMSNQMLLHVSAYQRHHQGSNMILTSYLHVGVHYKKSNGTRPKGTHWAVFHHSPLLPTAVSHNHLYPQCNNTDWS